MNGEQQRQQVADDRPTPVEKLLRNPAPRGTVGEAGTVILRRQTMTGTPTTPSAPAKPRTSGMAIASLVLGIAGLCTVGLTSIVGLILGIVALCKIGRSGGQMAGRGLALGGILSSAITLAIWLVAAAAGLLIWVGASKAWEEATVRSQHLMMMGRMGLLGRATMDYVAKNDDRFPPPDSWPQALKDAHVLADESMLADPRDAALGRIIAMNALLASRKSADVRRPGETVLYFECAPGAPPGGGPKNLPPEPRDPGGYAIGFCDGHVERIPIEELGRLIWNPEEERPNE
jgi:prepilin-type processing-associated H-X9-DG protein